MIVWLIIVTALYNNMIVVAILLHFCFLLFFSFFS